MTPSWSPKGDRIAFIGAFEAYHSELYTISSSGKELIRLSDNLFWEFPPQWATDGKSLVYASFEDSESTEIYSIRQDGSEKERLTDNKWHDLAPVWSRGGKEILFVARKKDGDYLCLMDSEGNNIRVILGPNDFKKFKKKIRGR